MGFSFPLSMQSLDTNLLLSGSLILKPRSILNRMERQFMECVLKLKRKLKVKENACCVRLTFICKGTSLDYCLCSDGHLSLAGNLNSESPQKTESS